MSARSSAHSQLVHDAKKRSEAALRGKAWATPKKKKPVRKPAPPKSKPTPATSTSQNSAPKKRKKVGGGDDANANDDEDDDEDGIQEINEEGEQEEQLRLESLRQKAKAVSGIAGGWDDTTADALFDLLQDETGDAVNSADGPAQRLQKLREREVARDAAETVNTILTGYVNCLIPAFGFSYLIE